MTTDRICLFCAATIADGAPKKQTFCNQKCCIDYLNRRRDRGAQLYDMFMGLRFERDEADRAKLWSAMCRLAAHWRQQDLTVHDRPTWKDWRGTLDKNPWLRAKEGRI